VYRKVSDVQRPAAEYISSEDTCMIIGQEVVRSHDQDGVS
jgi:hypothetical protein